MTARKNKSNSALVSVAASIHADTVTIDTSAQNATDTVTLRDVALSFDDAAVLAMCDTVKESFDRRDTFEVSQGVAVDGVNAYTKARKRFTDTNRIAVARLFLALDIAPSSVIERKVVANAMFSAYALDKISEIASLVSGIGDKVQKVTKAFMVCAIAATDSGVVNITNDVNKRFLNNHALDSVIADAETRDYIDAQRHKAISAAADTQSSQMRNVLDALGCGVIKSIDRARDAIALNVNHALIAMFRAALMK